MWWNSCLSLIERTAERRGQCWDVETETPLRLRCSSGETRAAGSPQGPQGSPVTTGTSRSSSPPRKPAWDRCVHLDRSHQRPRRRLVQGRVLGRTFLGQGGEAVHGPVRVERRRQAEEHRPAEGAEADPRPAVQRLSVEGGGVGQHLLAVRRSLMVGGVLLVGGLLDHADRLPSDLKSSSPA